MVIIVYSSYFQMTTQTSNPTGHGFLYKDLVILVPEEIRSGDKFATILRSMLSDTTLPILYTHPLNTISYSLRTLVFEDSVWKMIVHKNVMTLICIHIKSKFDILERVSTIVEYIINTIKDASKIPSIANAVKYSVYMYSQEPIKTNINSTFSTTKKNIIW